VEVAKKVDPPCKAVFHLTGVSKDVKIADFKGPEDFTAVSDCKALGAWHLSELTRDMDLENFVVVSSIAALVGGLGQASYSASNAFLDALIRYRRSQGLPGTTFNLASLADAGAISAATTCCRQLPRLTL
jgi:NAD(P)-dependent dehydrogenase (short-subunit alcohol dehydrogenase family)